MENYDLKSRSTLQNEEHFAALQSEQNKARKNYIDSLNDLDRNRFLKIEELVGEFAKLDVAFALWVNPFGYDFNEDTERGIAKGFWRYQKLNSNSIATGSKESLQSQSKCLSSLIPLVLNYFSVLFEDMLIQVYCKRQPWFASYKGKTVMPKKEN